MDMGQSKPLPWAKDELVLALNLYLGSQPFPFSAAAPEVIELSNTLRHLPLFPVSQRPTTFRSPAAVLHKLGNLKYVATNGREGFPHYAAGDRQVWEEFAGDTERLRAVAAAIRQGIDQPGARRPSDDPSDVEGPEGRILLRLHQARERDAGLVRKRKQQAFEQFGALTCEACGFDFKAVYGELGKEFIECHHTLPVSQLPPAHKTKVTDLALVCSNCHRMLHRGGEVLTIEALRVLLSRPGWSAFRLPKGQP